MDVTVRIHLEATDEGACWWAESDDVPGFTAAADSLAELRALYRPAIAGILAEEGGQLDAIREQLVGGVTTTGEDASVRSLAVPA